MPHHDTVRRMPDHFRLRYRVLPFRVRSDLWMERCDILLLCFRQQVPHWSALLYIPHPGFLRRFLLWFFLCLLSLLPIYFLLCLLYLSPLHHFFLVFGLSDPKVTRFWLYHPHFGNPDENSLRRNRSPPPKRPGLSDQMPRSEVDWYRRHFCPVLLKKTVFSAFRCIRLPAARKSSQSRSLLP